MTTTKHKILNIYFLVFLIVFISCAKDRNCDCTTKISGKGITSSTERNNFFL